MAKVGYRVRRVAVMGKGTFSNEFLTFGARSRSTKNKQWKGFWSLVKRGISGVNHAVSKKYLQNYLNEYAFRYNRRQQEEPMFEAFLTQIVVASERRV